MKDAASAGRGLVLHRFALGAHFGDHRPHLAHAHAIRDLDFDLVVVDTLVTLPTSPPEVMTVSPRRTFLTISACCLTRFCCGRMMRKYMMTMISANGNSE